MAVSNEVIRALVEEDEEETFILITVAAVVCACVKMMQMVMLGLMEETGEFRDPTAHVENYVEVTVPRYADRQFHEHFRMGRDVFERLLEWIAPSMPHERTIRLEKSVLVTVWYIGNMETYRSIADRFGLNKGSVKRIVVTVCGILTQRQGELIKWPTSIAEMEVLAQEFQERCDFPGVVGAVDGTHVEILPPNDFRDSYFNKNGTPSLQLEVVANHNLLFLDVFCGYPGSVHDARVWRNLMLIKRRNFGFKL